jgi:CDP-diacylglycerol--glycerol-3-phosphate 3-phosphatidyltransferase
VPADPAPRGDAILSDRLKNAGRVALAPLINALAAAGVTPNAVTVAGLLLVGAASLLIWQRSLLLGAIFLAIGAGLDAVDGGLARARGGGTPFGAFLDSTLDRTGEALVYIGIAAYWIGATAQPFVPVMLAVLALSGSFLVSYSRARAEAAGFAASNGLAPRTERLILIVLGLAIAGLGYTIALPVAMGLIAILAWVTVAQRIWNVHQQAAAAVLPPTIGQDKES